MSFLSRLPVVFRLLPVLLSLLLAGCATSPTGRHQLRLFPESDMAQMGAEAFAQLKAETPICKDAAVVTYVRCVANSVTSALSPSEGPRQWEVVVFEDPQANAFALPGGKIGVYTGLLQVANTQDQLATVLGHEVAHVLAGHGNERMSTTYATQTGLQALEALAGGRSSPNTERALALLGVGAQVGVLLPFSRAQEAEADRLGLDLMARAGFNPRESVTLWKNMASAGGGQPPEFLSTHPSHQSRIQELAGRVPAAEQVRADARRRGANPHCTSPSRR
jgi:predicted Zn-dependent protease